MKTTTFERLLADRAAKHPVALVTRLSDACQALVYRDQPPAGDLALEEGVLDQAQAMLHSGRSGMLSEPANTYFLRSYVPAYRLVIVGAVHIAQKLAVLAREVGYQVTVVDPRGAFATQERFPGIDLRCDWPDEALPQIGLDAQTAVVTLTHDPKIDDPAIIEALNSQAFYIGCLGSTRTHAKRVARLQEQGLGDQIERLFAPVGLDLGGRSPAEVAVATLAQIIQARYR